MGTSKAQKSEETANNLDGGTAAKAWDQECYIYAYMSVFSLLQEILSSLKTEDTVYSN